MINLLKIKYSIIRQGLTIRLPIVFFMHCKHNDSAFCDVLKIVVKLKTNERLLNWLTGGFVQTARTILMFMSFNISI